MASKLLKQASLPHSREVMENFGWLTTKRTLPTALLIAGALIVPTSGRLAAQAPDPCAPTTFHAIACENSKPGNPPSEWDVTGAGDAGIQGFATDISVNKGQTVSFKIKTTASAYSINIYRLGYYGGQGARKIVTVNPSVALPQSQPACVSDTNTGLLDCGNWAVSGSWAVPSTATSGVYIAKVIRTSNGTSSHIVFIVRDDAGNSELLFQTADTTWQAYNSYGGNSLYVGAPAGRAYKVSYNRPFNTRAASPEDWVFNGEYPMIRWLEANGYDVSYTTGVDTDRRGAELLEHRVFLSVGHDEYWSGVQRTNVETARALGVHLAFFSGNEVFWKTRWENSIAGPTTSHRTLVTYKETHDNAKTDPSPEWTGTWRDPRFSPPSDGGRPENALTGTLFMINDPCNVALKVPAADGKMRFWRNTSVATLSAGQTATMASTTLGYECDEDVDNGFRPAGLVRLSSTIWNVTSKLLDYGSTYGPGTANHALTLYRHTSGALVFGAGTIQWAWGLDGTHDRGASTPDVRMQQGTVNLLADMNAQPATLRPGLVAATISTDTARPDSAITSPSAGATFPAGQSITISGTATDIGGVVGGVEVSVNGGQSWHPATGRATWTYAWQTSGSGSVTIMSRAVDDSAIIEDVPAQVTVTVGSGGPPSCPCSIWSSSQQPAVASDPDNQAIEVGVKFQSNTAGQITALRFYKGAANTGTHVGHLWSASGTLLSTATFTGESASGWQQVTLPSPVTIQANTTYVASYFAPSGRYAFDEAYFATSGVTNGPLRALANSESPNGPYAVGGGFPNQTYNASNYWVDVVFTTATGPDTTPPTVTSTSPASNATGVQVSAPVTATFNEALTASTVTSTTFELRTSTNALVPATVTYSAVTNTTTLTPSSALSSGATYSARLKSGSTGVKDAAGNALAADYVWSFTTATSAPACPCSIWSPSQQPALASDPDDQAIEIGVKFQSDTAGQITALRFYKGTANTGTHVGHLWTASGTVLATATFTGESASGWQQVTLPSPVTIQVNTTYVASYFAPAGHYAFDDGYFLAAGVTNPPLHALGNSVSPNGVYVVGGGFPNQTWNGSNYWVDVVFATATGPDTTPPTVTSTSPVSNATGVQVSAPVTATFNEALNASTVTSTTFELRTSTNTLVPAAVTYSATTNRATLTPSSSLSSGATYSARLKSGSTGVKDAAGNALAADYVWSFTTSASGPVCPCTIWSPTQLPALASDPDDQAIEVGVKFQADVSGQIAGIRFYKGTANLGPHVGNLWTASGTLLASATFTSESGSGWQQVTLATPVSILANTTYVVSYYAPSGHYAFDDGYFIGGGVTNPPLRALANSVSPNGVYSIGGGFPNQTYNASNYWVDVVFVVASVDTTPPTITSMTPTPSSTGVSISTPVTATFNEPMDPSSIASSTFELRTSTNSLVTAAVTYSAATRTAVLTPSSALSTVSSYTAKVKGGASGVRDVAGNALASDQTWLFTTSGSSMGCPCSIWPPTIAPDVAEVAEPSSIEIGLNFQAQVPGTITGIRFYKGPNNTGTHIGNLWTSSGTLLATTTFSNESPSGWQQVTLGSPVVLVPNTTYVVSYFAPNGRHAFDSQYFSGHEVLNPPLKALGSSEANNGLYRYGPSSGFPTDSFGSSNYWVDVVFSPSGAPDTTPPTVTSTTPTSNATGVSASVTVIAAFTELLDGSSVNTTTFQLRNAANQIVPSSVDYNPASGSVVLTPTVLVASSVYTATLTGGFSGIRDRNGNPLAANYVWSFTTSAPPPATPDEGPGGPVLIVTSSADPIGRYYAEILTAEGLNAYTATDISTVTASKLANFNVVILAEMPLTGTQVSLFTTWVNGGGNLIAMRPDAGLASLLGLSPRGSTLANAYLLVDTAAAPGAGIVGQTMQFHGTADRYSFAGGSMVASLYSNAVTPTGDPAVTLRTVGTGMAAAFTYDLATSIVQTRQGNPMWAGQERDGLSVLRSSDLYFGAAATDVQPDWIDFAKVQIPQADEQQRLLANLITHMVSSAKPLPRFWYFPRGHKAVVVMTGDDHANNGTAGRFDQQVGFSPVGCSVADWECVRSTSYIYPNTPITNTQVAAYTAQGFEVALHLTTGCANYTPATLGQFFTTQLGDLAAAFPSNPAPKTNRTHCIVWSDWSTQASVALQNGIRLDTTYYYWPGTWVDDRPGFFTGSGMPMRFASLTGQRIDVYQAATQMTDESSQSQPATSNTLLDNAIGPQGYYGAFTANMHTDLPQIQIHDDIVLSAIARGVPIVSAKQMLTWLDGRNASSFSGMTWAGNNFSLTITVAAGARNLRAMLPTQSGTRTLSGITRGGSAVAFTRETIKGVEYAVFTVATTGTYVAAFSGSDTPGITIADVSLTEPASGTVAATFTLQLSSSSTQAVSVNYATANGTATAPSDYVAASGTVTFPIGTTSRTVSVTVNADAVNEAAETFVVNLSAPTNATIDRAQAVGTIQNALVAPSAPTSLTAAPVAAPRVDLSWSHTDAFESGFRIERKTGTTGTYAEITTVGANVTIYGDTTVAGGTTYVYRVRAYNAAGNSGYTNEATATTPAVYTGTGLYAEYFDNSDLTSLKKTRTDATVNFNWGTGSPDPAIGANTFSVRWIGQVQPKYSQSYTFYASTDNGVRLWVNGVQIINQWANTTPLEKTGVMTLTANQKYALVMEYYENTGSAQASLRWSSSSQAKQIIPQVHLYPVARPSTPTSLTATAASSSQINLSWVDLGTNETGFKIERATGGGAFTQIATVAAGVTTYNNTGLSAATSYSYRVRATNAVGDSGYSNTATRTTSP